MVFIKDKYFTPIYEHIERTLPDRSEINQIKIGDKVIGFTVKDSRIIRNKTFYSMKYKIGTDELNIQKSLELIEELPSNVKSGYTSKIRKEIETEETLIETTIKYEPSLSPMIHARTHKEFTKVKCFDITSFYPFLLTQDLPHFIGRKKSEDIEWLPTRTYYGGIYIKNIKAKTSFYPISLVGKSDNREIKSGQGINIVHLGTRLISADEVIIYGFLPFLLDALKEYDYEFYEITKNVYVFELRPDNKLRNLILEKFELKQSKKRQGLDYDGEKVLLNRLFGYFITKHNNAAAHYSQYIVQKGKNILLHIIREIGLADVIHSHTDSIKFIGDHEDVIERYNSTIEFEELGKFANEGIMEKVYYYGTNKAKYLMNGELKFKHGGIEETDIECLKDLNYDDITKDTVYMLTVSYTYTGADGFKSYQLQRRFGGSLLEE